MLCERCAGDAEVVPSVVPPAKRSQPGDHGLQRCAQFVAYPGAGVGQRLLLVAIVDAGCDDPVGQPLDGGNAGVTCCDDRSIGGGNRIAPSEQVSHRPRSEKEGASLTCRCRLELADERVDRRKPSGQDLNHRPSRIRGVCITDRRSTGQLVAKSRHPAAGWTWRRIEPCVEEPDFESETGVERAGRQLARLAEARTGAAKIAVHELPAPERS